MERTSLSEVERERALEERIDSSIIEETKIKWFNALKIVSDSVSRNCSNINVVYEPKRVFAVGIAGYDDRSDLLIGTPRKKAPFDHYPTLEAKIGAIAHEFGHLADYEQYEPFLFKNSSFGGRVATYGIDQEQRASLYAFALFPRESQELVRERLQSCKRRKNIEYPHACIDEYTAIETLGEIGMPRTFNVARFYKRLCDEGVLSSRYVDTTMKSSLYGLATPPNSDLNMLVAFYKAKDLHGIFSDYMNGKITEEAFEERKQELGSIQYVKGYNPARSIDYSGIIRNPSIERLQAEKERWRRISCTPKVKGDMITALDYCIGELRS